MMKAWVADGKGGIDFRDVPRPVPAPNQALVRCRATTIARGQVRYLGHMPEGRVLGLDIAGVVEEPAADGSGPPKGAHVIAMTAFYGGGWGEYAAVPTAILGTVPQALSWKDAGLLPNSGLTALYAVRQGGFLLGKRVLVTGATGGVGRIAAQLAKLSGAQVTGTVRSAARAASLAPLGLADVVVADAVEGPYDLIVETLGGASLGQALQIVAGDGIVVTIGGGEGFDTPADAAVVPHGWFFLKPAARLVAENVGTRVMQGIDVAANLSLLGRLVSEGALDLDESREESWDGLPDEIARMTAGGAREAISFRIG